MSDKQPRLAARKSKTVPISRDAKIVKPGKKGVRKKATSATLAGGSHLATRSLAEIVNPGSEFGGLPAAFITSGQVAVETDKLAELRQSGFTRAELEEIVVPRRTLDRRQRDKGILSPAETDRALRLERVHAHSVRVFGNAEKANRWLRKPCKALDGAVPIDLLKSETGAHIVEQELHAIDHGMFV